MFVYNTFRPDYRVLKEAKSLQESGYDVTIVAFRTNNITPREVIDGVKVIRIDLYPFYKRYHPYALLGRKKSPFSGEVKSSKGQMDSSNIAQVKGDEHKTVKEITKLRRRKWNYRDYYRRALKLREVKEADIYHCHDLNTLPLGVKASKRFGGKIVYDSHELFTEVSNLQGREKKMFQELESKLIGKADVVITVNRSIAGELVKRYGIEEPEIIMNCPEHPGEVRQQESQLRSYAGVPEGRPIVLYQGGYGYNRGLEELILSMQYLENGVLVMMGWGKIEGILRGIVAENNLDSKVFFVPGVEQNELINMTAGASVGVIPYKPIGLNNYYTSPNKLFEYMNAGVPVAGSDVPELRRFLVEYGAGMVFEPGNPKSMGETISEMLSDKNRLEKFKQTTFELSKEYNWERQAEKLVETYKKLNGSTG